MSGDLAQADTENEVIGDTTGVITNAKRKAKWQDGQLLKTQARTPTFHFPIRQAGKLLNTSGKGDATKTIINISAPNQSDPQQPMDCMRGEGVLNTDIAYKASGDVNLESPLSYSKVFSRGIKNAEDLKEHAVSIFPRDKDEDISDYGTASPG